MTNDQDQQLKTEESIKFELTLNKVCKTYEYDVINSFNMIFNKRISKNHYLFNQRLFDSKVESLNYSTVDK